MLWIGGAPGAGKRTIATRLARRFGLRLYSADTRTWVHRDRAIAAGIEAAIRWESMTPEERWEHATPEEMLAMSLHRERGAMVIDDLRALPRSPLVVAEGTTLPARGVANRARAVWLLPSPEFQRARLAERRLAPGPAALYERLAAVIAAEAAEAGVPTIALDGSQSLDDVVGMVERQFAEAIKTGLTAITVAERQALLREANGAVAAQVRGFFARPWASGSADGGERPFLCECGADDCVENAMVTVADAEERRVFARGHEPRP